MLLMLSLGPLAVYALWRWGGMVIRRAWRAMAAYAYTMFWNDAAATWWGCSRFSLIMRGFCRSDFQIYCLRHPLPLTAGGLILQRPPAQPTPLHFLIISSLHIIHAAKIQEFPYIPQMASLIDRTSFSKDQIILSIVLSPLKASIWFRACPFPLFLNLNIFLSLFSGSVLVSFAACKICSCFCQLTSFLASSFLAFSSNIMGRR